MEMGLWDYDIAESTLTVVVTDDGQISTLPQMLDLKWLLPEMAVVYLVL
jgi:hypothetical protein